jgi:hypothetical protein
MHFHFREHYEAFSRLTQYPKFCHGLSQFQHNPRAILSLPVERGVVSAQAINELLPEGMTLFVDETAAFCSEHLQAVEPRDFFRKLVHDPDVQIPLLLTGMDPSLKYDVGYVAYEHLRTAVDLKFGSEAV